MFWGIYWVISAGMAFIPYILGVLVSEFLPYSPQLASGLWTISFVLLIVAGYGALAILISEEASKRGYSRKLFFWLSIGLTPALIGLIVPNLARKDQQSLVLPRVCIKCQNHLLPEAKFCSVCGQLSPLVSPVENFQPIATQSSLPKSFPDSPRNRNLVGGVGALLGAMTLISFVFLETVLKLAIGVFGLPGFVPFASSGAGLTILGVILLVRGFRAPVSQSRRS